MKKLLIILLCGLLSGGCSVKNIAEEVPEIFSGTETPTADNTVLSTALCASQELQPHSAQHPSSRAALRFVYEPLFDINSSGEPVPVLAESLEANGREITINLKKDVKFHDGSEFTATDAVYTINLVKNGQSVYSSDIIESVSPVNSHTVRVILTRSQEKPETIFVFPIVKNKAPLSTKNPVGTGPYSFAGKDGFDTYTFLPFDDGTEKSHSKVQMIYLRDPEREKELFQSGESDIAVISSDELSYYTPRANAELYTYPTNQMIYIGFNCESALPPLRKAIFHTIDRYELTEKIYTDMAVPALSFSTPGTTIQTNTYNIGMAESEMKSGGYEHNGERYSKWGKPVKVRIIARPGGKHYELAELLKFKLENFGIECILKNQDNFYDDIESGAYEIVIDTCPAYGEAAGILKPGNAFNYQSEALDMLFESGFNSADFNNILTSDVPVIPIAYRCAAVAVGKKIKNTPTPSYTNPFNGIID